MVEELRTRTGGYAETAPGENNVDGIPFKFQPYADSSLVRGDDFHK